MPSTHQHHEALNLLLAQRKWDDAQTYWLDLAAAFADHPDFLLVLVKEFANADQTKLAAELAALLAPSLKSAGKDHEWLYALKLQTQANPSDKNLRIELAAAYAKIYENDARLKAILAVAALDSTTTLLPAGIAKVDTLLALNTGNYCQHKSWGVGKVKNFDTALNRVVVAFAHNADHAMQLPYAADSLAPISADHIEVRKQTDLPALQKLASADPVALIRIILLSHHHAASADKIENSLAGSVIPTANWKKWWDSAKRALKRDPHYEVPAKKTEPILLRSAPIAQQDELLEAFRIAPGLDQKNAVTRQLLKIIDDIADSELILQEFQDGLLDSLKKLKASHAVERLEAAFSISDIRAHLKIPTESVTALVDEILTGVRDLPGLLDELTVASQKRVAATVPDRLLADLNRLPVKTLDVLADKLEANAETITNRVRNQTASPDLLYWIYKNRATHAWLQPLHTAAMLQAMISAIESGQPKSTKRLRDLLFSDEDLIPDLLAGTHTDTVKDIARQILNCPAFEELDRRSLMARVVKAFPFVQEFLVTKSTQEQPLIVSKASYDKRSAELEDLVTKRIPENSKEIGVARSYGDLRENFEFKAAKDTQKVLMRRRAELEVLMSRAQPTDFSDTKTDAVGIGTTVTLTDLATKQPVTYHILGAWDSDPARGIISYPAALAQAMFNKKTGDVIETAGDIGIQKLRIDRITKTGPEILRSL